MLFRFLCSILELLFPPYCCHCHKTGDLLCDTCYESIIFLPKSSLVLNQSSYLSSMFAIAEYDQVIKSLIHSMKYKHIKKVTLVLGKMLYYCACIPQVDYITAVPMHPWKYNQRGYNQAELIAKELAQHSNIEYLGCLEKKYYTQSQASIQDKTSRKLKAANMYRVLPQYNKIIANKKILIIDDVYTTGSTLNACARALKMAKAKEIYGLVIAHKTN